MTEPLPIHVHSIETLGTHDGPGLRTVVFLQGCKLQCIYCQNPDTWAMEGGKDYSVEELLKEILREKAYFGKKGGVTFSGGEPLLQAKALLPLFKALKEEGIHIALDTNGRVLNHFVQELMDRYTDLVMLDIKHMNEAGYQAITGMKNVDTTFRLAQYRESSGKAMWLRYVLIPGLTDSPAELQALGQYFQSYKSIERLEIQPYHNLGAHKWELMGWDYPLAGQSPNSAEQLERAQELLAPFFNTICTN